MLRKIRIGISVVLFALITFYFLDFANILPNSFHRLAHIQFVPAVLSLSIGILIVLIALMMVLVNPVVRTYLLLYHLSDGNMAGCYSTHFKVCGKEEKKISVQSCKEYTEMDRARSDCNCLRMRLLSGIGIAGPV